ncbi:MAG: RNA polymerase factor sigma-54 [Campylobacterales bacterium]
MKLRVGQAKKQKLSSTLRNWLPLLQCPLHELEERVRAELEANPFVRIQTNSEELLPDSDEERVYSDDHWYEAYERNSNRDTIEALTTVRESLTDHLLKQIDSSLFPTPHSQKIARAIIAHLDEGGLCDTSLEELARELGESEEQIERVRQRFSCLTPTGVGAMSLTEALQWQLDDLELDEPVRQLARRMVASLDDMGRFKREPGYAEALSAIKRLKNPPAIDFLEEEKPIIPDLYIFNDEDGLKIVLNDRFYPEIIIEKGVGYEEHEFVRHRIREAKDLIDALAMRKATLHKLALMIVELQYDFFMGGDIRPMRLIDISIELGRNPSTISRAIANKYLACSRGIFPLKAFFSTAIEEDVSNAAIKEFIKKLIKEERADSVLSDEKILELVEAQFKVKMVRRTITKYRKEMDIPSSSERRRMML